MDTISDDALRLIAATDFRALLAVFSSGRLWHVRGQQILPTIRIAGIPEQRFSALACDQLLALAPALWRFSWVTVQACGVALAHGDLEILRLELSRAATLRERVARHVEWDLRPALHAIGVDISARSIYPEGDTDEEEEANMDDEEDANMDEAMDEEVAVDDRVEQMATRACIVCLLAARFATCAVPSSPASLFDDAFRVAATQRPVSVKTRANASFSGVVRLEAKYGEPSKIDEQMYVGPERMTPSAMMMLSALAMSKAPLDGVKQLTVDARSKSNWSMAFSLLGCACDAMPALGRLQLSGRLDDASATAFFGSLTTAELQVAAAGPDDARVETRWLFPLESLHLNGAGYGPRTVRCIAEKLGEGLAPGLRDLSFSGDAASRRLCDDGAAAIGAAFATGKLAQIRRIDLQNSSLTSRGLVAIANGLEEGLAASSRPPRLSSLKILDSRIGNDGIARLADVAAAHRITFIECRRTQVGLAGARALLACGIRVDHDRMGLSAQLRAELQSFAPRVLQGSSEGDGRY